MARLSRCEGRGYPAKKPAPPSSADGAVSRAVQWWTPPLATRGRRRAATCNYIHRAASGTRGAILKRVRPPRRPAVVKRGSATQGTRLRLRGPSAGTRTAGDVAVTGSLQPRGEGQKRAEELREGVRIGRQGKRLRRCRVRRRGAGFQVRSVPSARGAVLGTFIRTASILAVSIPLARGGGDFG